MDRARLETGELNKFFKIFFISLCIHLIIYIYWFF